MNWISQLIVRYVPSGQVWKPKRYLHKNLSVVSWFIAPLFSRNERTHPNFVSVCLQPWEIVFLWKLQIDRPLKFKGLLASFLCPSAALFLFFWSFFRCFRRFGIVWTGFHSDCVRQKKGIQSQCRLEWYFWPGENKLHHRKASVEEFLAKIVWRIKSDYDIECLIFELPISQSLKVILKLEWSSQLQRILDSNESIYS